MWLELILLGVLGLFPVVAEALAAPENEPEDAADGVEEYLLDGEAAWVGMRGESTVVALGKGIKAEGARAAFQALLADKGSALASERVVKRVARDLGFGARVWAQGTTAALIDFAGKQAKQPVPHGDFVKKRLLGFGFAAGPEWREHVRTEVVSEVVAAELQSDAPDALAKRWSEVLGRPVENGELALDRGRTRRQSKWPSRTSRSRARWRS